MKKKKKKQVSFGIMKLDCAIYVEQQMNGTFIHPVNFQVDLDSSLADLGDGEDTQGAFRLLLI